MLRMLLLMTLISGLTAGCQPDPGAVAIDNYQPELLEQSDYLVWSALLAEWYPPGTGVKSILLADWTDTTPMDGNTGNEITPYLREKLPLLDAATWRHYSMRRRMAWPLRTEHLAADRIGAPVRNISDAELAKLFAGPRGWETLHARYPQSSGIVSLSRPGYHPGRTQALVHFSSTMGPLAGSGHLVLLELRDGAWRVTAKAMTWIS